MAESLAKLHEVFLARLQSLQTTAAAVAASVQNGEPRPWFVPDSLTQGLLPKVLDTPFNRDEINANYSEINASSANGGTVGDVISLHKQLTYVAAEERAFRLRHASPCRTLVLAHGRLAGHGNPAGIFGRVQAEAAASIKATN